jgi:hypothetical protein
MKHKTKDGDVMLLQNMEDSHIMNTINFKIRNLEKSLELVSINPIQARLNGLTQDVSFSALNYAEACSEVMPHYFMEANLRGLDTREELEKYKIILGRDKLKNVFELECLSDDDDYNDDYNDGYEY